MRVLSHTATERALTHIVCVAQNEEDIPAEDRFNAEAAAPRTGDASQL